MKVLILSRAIPHHAPGGMEKYTMFLANGLASRKDIEVHILTTQHPENHHYIEENGIHIHFMPNKNPGKYSLSTFRMFSAVSKELDLKHSFDIIHSQGFAACMVVPRKSQKVIVSPHGTLFSETPLERSYFKTLSFRGKVKALWSSKNRLAFIPGYKSLFRIADIIHADSNYIKDELEAKFPKMSHKIKVVPLGIPGEDYQEEDKIDARKILGLNREDFIFFTLGRHAPLKGFHLVLEAAAKLKYRKFTVIIGGNGPMSDEYKKLASQLHLKNIMFMGRIPEEQLAKYFAAADFFIVPDISSPAFGLVSLEAFLQNTPVIASDAGALPEVVTKEFGLLFRKNDSADLAKIMEEAISKRGFYSTISPLAQHSNHLREKVLKKFSFDKMIESIVELYFEK